MAWGLQSTKDWGKDFKCFWLVEKKEGLERLAKEGKFLSPPPFQLLKRLRMVPLFSCLKNCRDRWERMREREMAGSKTYNDNTVRCYLTEIVLCSFY